MDIFLAIIGGICIIAGIIGCVAPVLPGPPLSYFGLLLFHWTKYAYYSPTVLWILGIVTIIVTVVDNFLPILMTKKLGGTKYGTWGATAGVIIGMFFGLPGIIIGPFAGALIGELIAGVENKKAIKSAWGSFLGFILGTGAKFSVCLVIAYFYVSGIFT